MQVKWPCEFPGVHWLDEEEEEAVLDVLRSRAVYRYYGINKPKYVDALEASAREFYGTRYALAVNSGSGALITAMLAMGIGPGDEVIIPTFMWVATVAAVVHVNAIPVLCEVDESLTMDPVDLEKRITPRTRLIVPVHMAGSPCNMDAVMTVANRHGIPVLEDVAQSNGASYRGRKLGTFGTVGIFSFQINKNATAGEGGLLITNDEKLYGRAFSAHDMSQFWRDGKSFDPPSESLAWAGGRRMPELCGACASVQIRKLPRIVAHMQASHRRISALLEGTPGLTLRPLRDPDGDAGPFLILLFENAAKATRVAERMRNLGLHSAIRIADYGLHVYSNILTLVNKLPLSSAGNPWSLAENAQSVYDYHLGACPQSDAIFARSILLPIPSCLTEELENQAAEAIRAAASN